MRRSAATLAMVLVALTAACGDKTSATEIVRAAQAKTVEAGTARIDLRLEAGSAQGGAAASAITGSGVFDFKARRGRLTIGLGTPGLAVDDESNQAEVVLIGDTAYVKVKALEASLKGKQWFKVTGQAGGDVLANSDPAAALSSLRGQTGDVSTVGKEAVRGEATTHYRANVDLVVAAEAQGASAAAVEKLKALPQRVVPLDVWVDGDGRARRLRMGVGGNAGDTITVELYDFGTAVDVEPPPADQVSDQTLPTPAG